MMSDRQLGLGALVARARAFLHQSHRESVDLLTEALPALEAAAQPIAVTSSVTVDERAAQLLLYRVAMAFSRREDAEKATVRVPRQLLIDTMAFLLAATKKPAPEHELLASVD